MEMGKLVHGDVISDLLKKTKEGRKRLYLNEINIQYKKWSKSNLEIEKNSKENIQKKVDLYNEYHKTISNEKYVSRERYRDGFPIKHPLFQTVLTEFCYYLFKDLTQVKNKELILADMRTLERISIQYEQLKNIRKEAIFSFMYTDKHLVIGANYELQYRVKGRKNWHREEVFIPFVIIALEQVLTRDILLKRSFIATEIKRLSPKCLYIIACETAHSNLNLNLASIPIDNIFVLRKQIVDTDKKPVDLNIVWKMYLIVRNFLVSEKEDYENLIVKGILK